MSKERMNESNDKMCTGCGANLTQDQNHSRGCKHGPKQSKTLKQLKKENKEPEMKVTKGDIVILKDFDSQCFGHMNATRYEVKDAKGKEVYIQQVGGHYEGRYIDISLILNIVK